MRSIKAQFPSRPIRRQRGVALILLLLLGIVVGGGFLIQRITSGNSRIVTNQLKTTLSLKEAKDALIAYATVNPDRPGELPCPDLDYDGKSDPEAGGPCVTFRGWFPHLTLGLTLPRFHVHQI